ncbi:MAG: molybdate ABC transporter substrate-binding protein [Desulfobulbaceae bacterium]|nr:molybdate ABC transporter substrate-binding protein [Desulfobulbaceae bacterium]
MNRYLVTGHSGFIGRHIVTELAREHGYIRGLSRQIAPTDNDAIVDARSADITQPATLTGLMRGIDTVIHAAGHAHVTAANPLTAPYGVAAKEYLQATGLWLQVKPQLVYGENIAQTLHFVVSGGAGFGLIAGSQARDERLPEATCKWLVPEELHVPIEQQAILLRRGERNKAATEFLAFVAGTDGRQIIEEHGYSVPQ